MKPTWLKNADETIFCTPAEWTDVGKFLLLNYATHAITVWSPPGAPLRVITSRAVVSFFMPFARVLDVLSLIMRFPVGKRDDELAMAARSMVLATVVKFHGPRAVSPPEFQDIVKEDFTFVNPATVSIHGRVNKSLLKKLMASAWPDDDVVHYRLVFVPMTAKFQPITTNPALAPTSISHNYSMIKALAAIVQAIYGSYELYQARGPQIERYGYASYALTVIPYILMSFLNLVAGACAPTYNSVFLVQFDPRLEEEQPRNSILSSDKPEVQVDVGEDSRTAYTPNAEVNEKMDCVVGKAYWNPTTDHDHFFGSSSKPRMWLVAVVLLTGLLLPYVLMYIMTSYRKERSTLWQRIWITLWTVSGPVGVMFMFLIDFVFHKYLLLFPLEFRATLYICAIVVGSVGCVGGVTTVVKMIMEFGICTKL